MFEIIVTVLIGVLGGVAVGIQAPMAGTMSQRVGAAACSLIVHVSGAIAALVVLVLRGGENIQNWHTLSWYMLGSGVFGVVLHMTLSHTIPRLGATTAIVLIIVGQLTMGMLIDQFGLFGVAPRPIDQWRLLAIVLLIAGAYLMIQ